MKTGISLIVGPPGAGKGLWLIQQVADILVSGNQTIVTNFAIKLPELNEWLQRNFPDLDIDVHERICFLNDHDENSDYFTKRFNLVRGNGRILPRPSEIDEKNGVPPNWELAKEWPPCAYIIDEADLHFDAREWANFGKGVNHWQKQHRKLGDRGIYCCQDPKQIDRKMRDVCQETIVLKNLGKIQFSIFRLPKVFSWSSYYKVPSGPHAMPMVQGSFRLPIQGGLENCFDTAAGVGLCGTFADKGEKQKGISVFWLLVPFILLLVLVYNSSGFGGFIARRMNTHGKEVEKQLAEYNRRRAEAEKARMEAVRREVLGTNDVGTAAPGVDVGRSNSVSLPDQSASPVEPPVFMTGFYRLGDVYHVFFSNGSRIDSNNPLLTVLNEQFCVVAGKKYFRAPTALGGFASHHQQEVAAGPVLSDQRDPVWRGAEDFQRPVKVKFVR